MSVPSKAAITAWVRLDQAYRATYGALELSLKQAGLPSLEWYDVLLELERAGPQRPRELQTRVKLAQYNVSRLLSRMAKAGIIQRQDCPGDRRGHLVEATAEGQALRRRMWRVAGATIETTIGTRLGDDAAGSLADLLARLAPPHAGSDSSAETSSQR